MYFNPSVMGYPNSLPPQMLSWKEKSKDKMKWAKDVMDSLEAIGRMQIILNARSIENYQMVRGQFIFQHYFDKPDYQDLTSALTQEFEIPSQLRHYDIISQVINTLSGEWQTRPDIFSIKGVDDITKSEYVAQKTEMLNQYVMTKVQQGILQKLQAQGVDVARTQFNTEEEQQQYQEDIQKKVQELTPPEIQKYMNISWRTVAEIWAENQMEIDKFRFNQKEMDKIEFEDYLTVDRCYRHGFLTGNINGYGLETWNPLNTFHHKSPEVRYVEEGDYVGRIMYASPADVINRYGYKMKIDDIKDLDKDGSFNKSGNGPHVNMIYDTTRMPFKDYRDYTNLVNAFGADPLMPINQANLDLFGTIYDDTGLYSARGLVQVCEAYWKSQRKIGKVTILDETNQIQSFYVDETFDTTGMEEIPDGIIDDVQRPNTVVWTWINQVWKGIKISAKNTQLQNDIYIDLGPSELQLKSDLNPYGCKLPVVGQIFNNRNAQSMSLVDLMKPHQIGYNVAMNQLYQIMQREIGKFLIMDVNMLPILKDWGEKNFEKFMLVAKELGIAPADTSPKNMKGANPSNTLPKEIDFDESARMLSRGKLAEFFEGRALAQVGITPQRLGSIAASETATGVQEAISKSYSQTESYFTNFSLYKRRCLQMQLEIAQYVQSKNKDISLLTVKSDFTRDFIQLNGEELLLRDLQVYVSSNQEDKRILDTARQLFVQNNTTDADPIDLFTVIEANSPAKIKEQLKIAYQNKQKAIQDQRDHELQLQQQQIDAAKEQDERNKEFTATQNQLDREAKLQEAAIKVTGFDTDTQNNGRLDAIEEAKLEIERGRVQYDNSLQSLNLAQQNIDSIRKHNLEKEKLRHAKELQNKEHKLSKEEMQNKIEIENKKQKAADKENKTQLELSKEKHEGDQKLIEKKMELEKLKAQLLEKKQKHEIEKAKASANTEKSLGKIDVNTEKKLANVKVNEAESISDNKINIDYHNTELKKKVNLIKAKEAIKKAKENKDSK